MGHIHHKNSTHIFGYFGKALKVDGQGIGTGTGDDQFGLGFMGFTFHGFVVNLFLGIQAVGDDIEPFATDVQRHAMR